MQRIKALLRNVARQFGIYLASNERLGIDPDLDLARLSSSEPLLTIFDVGANFGQTACRYATVFPQAMIFSFEPVPTSFDRLLAATKYQKRIKPFNLAIGEVTGKVSMNLTQDAGRNSIMTVQAATSTVEVPVETLDRFAQNNGIQTIDLLKIDVEGYELKVLEGAKQLLEEGRVRYIYAECIFSPNSEMPHVSLAALNQVLEDAGFCFVNYYPESFNLRLGCAQGNVLYALKSKLPGSVPGRIKNMS